MVSMKRKVAIMNFTSTRQISDAHQAVEELQRGANTAHPGIKQTLQRVSSLRDALAISFDVMKGIFWPLISSAVSRTVLPAECVPTIIACPSPTMTYGKQTIEAAIIFAMYSNPFLSSYTQESITSRHEIRMKSW